MPQRILVTGGAGYIGSHACVSLLEAGFEVVVADNLSNSSRESLVRVEEITAKSLTFVHADLCHKEELEALFERYRFAAVLHFAGLKAVGESVAQPLRYFSNNVGGTLNLLEVMAAHGCKRLVFSSSATVYGDPAVVPIVESAPVGAVSNPYGRCKHVIETMLMDLYAADASWDIGILRYFNPVGAHPSGRIGEAPQGVPNNLMPYITQVAVGRRPQLQIFGDDYPTADGTGVRDYIHVMDLVAGHVAMLEQLFEGCGLKVYNLGTGRGTSVLELVKAFSSVNQVAVPYEVVARREGDIAACWADPGYAEQHLGWKATHSLEDMVRDAWRWQQHNPAGFEA